MSVTQKLPQHPKFEVAKSFDLGGITSQRASVIYGPHALIPFRNAAALFYDPRLFDHYASELAPARPVWTGTKVITLNMPLGDVKLFRDGSQRYLELTNKDGGRIELIQIDKRLLTPENEKKPSQLIVADNGWKSFYSMGKEFVVTHMLPKNDQRSIAIPPKGYNLISDLSECMFSKMELETGIAAPFMKEFGNVRIHLNFPDAAISGSLFVAGAFITDNDIAAVKENRMQGLPGALVREGSVPKDVIATGMKPKPDVSRDLSVENDRNFVAAT